MAKTTNKSFTTYLDESYISFIKDYAKKNEISVSQVLKNIVDKYMKTDDSSVKIILNIPKDVVKSSEGLEQWLTQRKNALVTHFKNISH